MHTKNDNIEIMIGEDTDEIFQELLDSLLPRYKTDLKESMKCDDFVFDYVGRLHYTCHKIHVNHGDHTKILLNGSKAKKSQLNPILMIKVVFSMP